MILCRFFFCYHSLNQHKLVADETENMDDLQFGMSDRDDVSPSVILLVDVDCFEVQVWQKNKELPPEIPCLIANEAGMYDLDLNFNNFTICLITFTIFVHLESHLLTMQRRTEVYLERK